MDFELLFMECGPTAAKYDTGNLSADLRLDILFDAMSGGSNKIAGACRQVMTHPLTCEEAIYKRRAVVGDAVDNAGVFSEMLATADEAIKDVQAYSEFHSPKYDRVVSSANKIIMETEIARLYLKHLRGLTSALKSHSDSFLSDAMRKLCRLMDVKCSNDTLFRIENRIVLLDGLKTSGGVSISGRIGTGLKQTEIILNGLCGTENRRRRRPKEGQTAIPLSSASLIRNADEITETALAPVYRSIADFNKELRSFFEKLHFQLCFFVGCANLWRKLNELKIPICDPAIGPNTGQYGASMLIDASLALKEGIVPTENGFCFTDKRLIVITGANQGGKTTFLRGIGIAQVMAQCGMFVTASSYESPLFKGIYTHFPCSEDPNLKMGLLEAELNKLSGIIDRIKPCSLLLMNESFQSTMPLDAKHLADGIITAVNDAGVMAVFVTHLYAYASGLYGKHREDVLFLRAGRDSNGTNTFKLQEGAPYKSAFGMELFCEVANKNQHVC